MGMLSHLARNGLSMLAGELKTTRPALMGLRFGSPQVTKEVVATASHRGSIGDKEDNQPDVHKLTTNECWRLILKLGTQWPAWNRAATPLHATQGLMKENGSTIEVLDHGHPSHHGGHLQGKEKPVTLQTPQDFLKLLSTRALEALAQTPPNHHGRAAGGILRAPKQTTHEIIDSKAAGDALETPKPTPLAKAPSKTTSTRPQTSALIINDGMLNACDNVPADKERLNMMFTEKAGVFLNVQALLQSVTPSLQRPPQVTPFTTTLSQDLLHSKSSSQVASLVGTSSASSDLPPSCTHVEGSTSDQEPAECSHSAKTAISESPPMPTITKDGNSRHHVIVKPLPNARKNSLARFLDSRKRGTTSCSEDGSPKKQALGDGNSCPSDSNQDSKVGGKSPMPSSCSQSFNSKDGTSGNCHTASRRATSEAEVQDALVE